MDLLVNTSLATSFVAGAAALFAPCCISVLLPTYFASIFQQKRRVFFMTFVYFLGILPVFLPLGLGFGGLGQLASRLHDWIFNLGAVFLILLAFSILFRFYPTLPFHPSRAPNAHSLPSVFLLGLFSGLATTCCAPVLAGVLALSVLSTSAFWGGMYALGYVLGMVSPLFVIAFFLDKADFTSRFLTFRKSVSMLGRQITLSELMVSLTLLGMGVLILYLSLTHQLKVDSGMSAAMNLLVLRYVDAVRSGLASLPVFVIPLLFVLILAAVVWLALRRGRRS